jgi:hypothetical protein
MTSMRVLCLVLIAAPVALSAQQEPDARWLPWLGCWQVGRLAEPAAPLVCVRPTPDPLGVELATVTGGAIALSRAVIADDRTRDLIVDDCAGSEVATFSGDGRRVYLRSTLTCADGTRRTASVVMGMASDTVWLDAQSLGMDDERVPRVLRYSPAPLVNWPEPFRFSAERSAAVAQARLLATAELSLLDVREAATRADPEAVAAFLLELDRRFDPTVEGLAALDDGGVPGAVIDAVVAVSYPERFAVDRGEVRPVLPGGAEPGAGYHDSYYWGGWGYAWCPRSGYCYDDQYRPYGHDPFFSRGYFGRLVVFDRTAPRRGIAVGPRGYTRGGRADGSGQGRYARPRDSASGGSGSTGYQPSTRQWAPSSSGRASPGGYSRGGRSSSSGRGSGGTAKPKRN